MQCQTCKNDAAIVVGGGKIRFCSSCADLYYHGKEDQQLVPKCYNQLEQHYYVDLDDTDLNFDKVNIEVINDEMSDV